MWEKGAFSHFTSSSDVSPATGGDTYGFGNDFTYRFCLSESSESPPVAGDSDEEWGSEFD